MRVTISLPRELKERAKEEAYKRGASFSGFLRVLLERELQRHDA